MPEFFQTPMGRKFYGCPRGLMEARQRDFVARGPCS
jgi:hypothetical protein